jgi:hypothetical protein
MPGSDSLRLGEHRSRPVTTEKVCGNEARCPLQCGRARVNAVTESKNRQAVPERWNAAGRGSDM